MLKMLELRYANSRKGMNRVTLTVWFWTWGRLLMVVIWSRDSQQTIEMVRKAWEGLKPGNWFTTFVEFLQVCFLFFTPLISLFLICTCSLCTLEGIRVANLYQIPLNYDYWFMIWSFVQIFPNQEKHNLLCPFEPCTIWFHLHLYNRPKHAQNLKLWLVFDIFMILFWFYLI